MEVFALLLQAGQAAGHLAAEAMPGKDQASTEIASLVAQTPFAYGFAILMEKLKASNGFGLLRYDTAKLNRTVAILFAFLTAGGISLKMEGSFSSGSQIVLAIPPLASVVHFLLFDGTKSYVFQKLLWKGLVKNGNGNGPTSSLGDFQAVAKMVVPVSQPGATAQVVEEKK